MSMEKWLEFRVEDECQHDQDIYSGCPLCMQLKQQAEITELNNRIEEANRIHNDMFKKTGGVLKRTELCKIIDRQQAEIDELKKEVERLKEYEWMYNDLCK